jgi:hypothetical protein
MDDNMTMRPTHSSADEVPERHDICVVHLVWAPLGTGVVGRFLASYAAHRAGIGHDLVVTLNGIRSAEEQRQFESLFAAHRCQTFFLKGRRLDIPAYLATAQAFEHPYFCFLNSYSTILADDWLLKLYRFASRDDVGVVGATASYESVYTDLLMDLYPKDALPRWKRALTPLVRPLLLLQYRRAFPAFPNPHIRTTGFMLKRKTFLGLKPVPVERKMDAHRFESGFESLTRQVVAAGLQPMLIGKDGQGYPVDDWGRSGTFWQNEQSNLLLADNRTESYTVADARLRQILSRLAWGARRLPEER